MSHESARPLSGNLNVTQSTATELNASAVAGGVDIMISAAAAAGGGSFPMSSKCLKLAAPAALGA